MPAMNASGSTPCHFVCEASVQGMSSCLKAEDNKHQNTMMLPRSASISQIVRSLASV